MARSYTLCGSSGIAHVDRVDAPEGPRLELRLPNGDIRTWRADADGDRAALRAAMRVAFGGRS